MMTDKRMRRSAATILLFGAALALAVSLVTLLSGGFAVPAIGLSSRDPLRSCVVGLALLATARASTDSATFRQLIQFYSGTPDRIAARIAVFAAACLFVF